MADNNLALGRHDGPDIFAEDDPLAELARIVGYEDSPARPSAQAAAPRREPEFNLEDELMREFERYDAPRLDPANDIGAVAEPAQVRQPVEAPVMDEPRTVSVERAEPAFEPPAVAQPLPDGNPPLQHLPFDLAATAPSMPIQQAVPQRAPFSHADLVAELESSLAPVPQPQYEQPRYQPQPVEPVQVEPAAIAAPAPAELSLTERSVDKGYKPGFRMPIANFQRTDIAPREAYRPSPVEPAQVAVDVAPVTVAAPVEPAREAPVETNESIWSSLERELTGEAAAQQTESKPAIIPVVEKPVELSVFEMPKPVAAQAPVEPIRAEPSFQAKPAPSETFSQLEEMVYDVDHFLSQKPVTAPVAPQPVAVKPTATDADLIDDDFELALDDLDLDLSDISLGDDDKPAATLAVVQPVAAPVPAEPVYAARQPEPAYRPAPVTTSQPSYVPTAAYAPATTLSAAPAFAPAPPAVPVEAAAPEFDADSFDPTLIADGEEHVESMAEVDVPELLVDEPVAPAKHDPDFDIDLDAELANLLQASAPAAPSLVRGSAAAAQMQNAQARQPMSRATPTQAPVAVAQPAAAPAPAKSAYDADLDDFERALEEDFRRSLSNPLPDGGRMSDEDDDGYAAPVARRQVRWGAPVAVVGFLLMGGLSAYAYYASGLPGKAESGKPLVIAADKEPVKIAPENPGGKTVPNQDKAVYERVAGGANDAPRQETLISSNEEPMDVVQRTLTSDSLPLQGEEEAMTEGLDTQDPRLLPQQANGAPQGEQPVSVMPRKVRTMVVRPDGTLVEQEVTAPAAPVQQAAAPVQPAASEKVPAQPALAEPTVAPKTAHVAPVQPAPMSAPAAPAAPAQLVTASAPARPVPASRPADQPVNVVASVSDRGNVQQTSAAPQQVASVGPGGYFIQVASLPSQAEAQKSYQSLSSKFGNVIGGRGVDIKAAEIAGKGTFYRVRIPAGSKDQAVQLCENYRSAGGSCLVAR
ncbi:SPOR domain-containing protein [Neorhizobium sp. BT27B]|uniref:SPOR domain-containing protein n=1 Tax=Neorhizobium sp. BT27B TaxID=3142625 RepID=UPI003D296805